MDATRLAGPSPAFGSTRSACRHDEEEYDTVPRWLWWKLHAGLALSNSMAGRMARRIADSEGGQ